MCDDSEKIVKNEKLAVKADKSQNIYMLSREKYSKLLRENITADYKLADEDIFKEVLESEKLVAKEIDLEDRMEVPPLLNARITIKDHKNNFRTETKCRLLNPCNVDSGKVSQKLLSDINTSARKILKYQ